MSENLPSIDSFLQTFNRADVQKSVEKGESERQKLVKKFPLEEWSQLSLERYAYGQGNSKDTFSWALENGTKNLALLANHGSRTFKIFKKKDGSWWYESDFADAQEAWQSIRYMYQMAFARAKAGRWNFIDELHTSRHGANALLKTLVCYFPEELLPITSTGHLAHFLDALGVMEFDWRAQSIINLNRLLLLKLRSRLELQDWSNGELARLLYAWAPPSPEDDVEEGEESLESEVKVKNTSPAIDDVMYKKIAATLEHKGQVILFGPPGTGKTFTAENFAQRWLNELQQEQTIESTVAPKSETTRQSWLVVSNYHNKSWDKLFEQGKEIFCGGKVKANFKSIKEGDLIFGYTGAPKLKLEAIARLSRPMFLNDSGESCIELEPVVRIKRGLSFDEFAKNSTLKKSEAMRSKMRGTLFALTTKEADTLASLSIKKEATLTEVLHSENPTPKLTPTNGDKLIRLTFHPSYSYEDFIEGFRPDSSVSNNLTLKLKDGIFKRVCKEADANRNNRYLILIDEINRANLAKVFGEVVTVIEKDKRDLFVELPQSNEQFRVPPNVFIIGTMNTADRSIKLLDTALRRRFSFIEMQPDPNLLTEATLAGLNLAEFLEFLNAKLIAFGNRDKQIGHSFFMENGKPIRDNQQFCRAFRHDVLPLLQEYCYDRASDLAKFIGTELVDVERDCLFEDRINDDTKLSTALARVVSTGSRSLQVR